MLKPLIGTPRPTGLLKGQLPVLVLKRTMDTKKEKGATQYFLQMIEAPSPFPRIMFCQCYTVDDFDRLYEIDTASSVEALIENFKQRIRTLGASKVVLDAFAQITTLTDEDIAMATEKEAAQRDGPATRKAKEPPATKIEDPKQTGMDFPVEALKPGSKRGKKPADTTPPFEGAQPAKDPQVALAEAKKAAKAAPAPKPAVDVKAHVKDTPTPIKRTAAKQPAPAAPAPRPKSVLDSIPLTDVRELGKKTPAKAAGKPAKTAAPPLAPKAPAAPVKAASKAPAKAAPAPVKAAKPAMPFPFSVKGKPAPAKAPAAPVKGKAPAAKPAPAAPVKGKSGDIPPGPANKVQKARVTSGAPNLFRELIMSGKWTNDQIFAKVREKYPMDDKRFTYVNWYRNQLKKEDMNPPPPKGG